MTLTEAIKSQRYFKRPCWSMTIKMTDQKLFEIREFTEAKIAATLELFPDDITANDYILVDSMNINLTNMNL